MPHSETESVGQFWLASDYEAENWLPGKISFDDRGSATVEVFSAFADRSGSLLDPQVPQLPTLRLTGITNDNKIVTVDRARVVAGGRILRGRRSGVDSRRFRSDQVVLGHFYRGDDPIDFDRVALDIEMAHEWFGKSGIVSPDYSYDGLLKMFIEYQQQPSIPLQLTPTMSGQVWFGVKDFAPPAPWETKLNLEQTCSVSFHTTNERWDLEAVHDLAVALQAFFAVATGVPVAVREIVAWSHDEEQISDDAEREPRVRVPFRQYDIGQPVDHLAIPPQMPFVYEDIAEVFDQILANWLAFCERNRHTVHNAMRSRYSELTVIDHFLALARSVEVALGKAQAPRTPLRKLAQHLVQNFSAGCAENVDVAKFSKAVTDYRNWYVHYDKDRSKSQPDVDYQELATICDNLRAMLDIYMIAQCLPTPMNYRELLSRDGELVWALRRQLQFHLKHQRGDSSSC